MAKRRREVPRRIRFSQRSSEGATRDFVLEGHLAHVGLGTLLGILEAERRSGVIVLWQGYRPTSTGELILRDGLLIGAHLQGTDQLVGLAAAYALLGWRDGRFGFAPASIRVADELNASIPHLLLEAARRLDEEREQRTFP